MLSDSQKKLIQQTYSAFTSRDNFKPRYGQRLMIAEIAKYLGDIECGSAGERTSSSSCCVVEAGTGTGKTLAYMVSALPIAIELGKKLVISTATTTLQSQVITKDLPELQKNADIVFNYALAKGRGRYLCLSKLDQLLSDSGDNTIPLFLMDNAEDDDQTLVYDAMFKLFAEGKWDGDKDEWEGELIDEQWQRVTTDNQQCSKRRCSYFNTCPYFQARMAWDDADVIVANHDLVLADLSLGGGVVLPAPEESVYVFDEAHHLSEKALNHFLVSGSLHGSNSWLKNVTKAMAELGPFLGQSCFIHESIKEISDLSQKIHEQNEAVYRLLNEDIAWEIEDEKASVSRFRFPHGVLPDLLIDHGKEQSRLFTRMNSMLDEINEEFIKAIDDKSDCGLSSEEAEQWFPVTASFQNRAESYQALWHFYSNKPQTKDEPEARWLIRRGSDGQSDVVLYGSPLNAGGLLSESLWSRSFAAILTSATLTALGSFNRLQSKTGLPETSRFFRVPSPFDFSRVATLQIPNMTSDPGSPDDHTDELIDRLPEWIGEHKAVLVLFGSRRQMNDVLYGIDDSIKADSMSQDEMNKQDLISTHKERIDNGERSILFGLASLAEGVDLPGEYLTHVIVAKIPFAVPNDPLEEGLSEWLESMGRNPFMEMSVPDASLRLIQACGRLIRTEQDEGLITILDKRLLTRRYGSLLLDSLPPFTRRIAQQA